MALDKQYIAFYGTLLKAQHMPIREYLKDKLLAKGNCLISGNIYDMGRYPALKLDENRSLVRGELYEIDDPAPLKLLDDYEAKDNIDSSLPGFTRRLVQLDSPNQTAWVYEYDGPVNTNDLIVSGDWSKK
jgi:gamma-glutamylcyclotransferase (GGCT)/AIG2-like uncharacterized protein YtfP